MNSKKLPRPQGELIIKALITNSAVKWDTPFRTVVNTQF